MTQNILALIIVFLAALITVYSVIRSITSKKTSNCGSCPACEAKKNSFVYPGREVQKKDFRHMKIVP